MPGSALASEPPRVALARPNLKFNHKLHATPRYRLRPLPRQRRHAAGAGHARGSADDGDLPRLPRRQAGDRALLGLPPHRAGRAPEDEAGQRRDHGRGRQRAAGAVGLVARHRRPRPDVQARPRPGRTRRGVLPDLSPAAGVHRLPRRRGAAARHSPVGLRLATRDRRAPEHARLLVLPPGAVVLRRLPPAVGGRRRPRRGPPRPEAEQPVRDRDRAQELPPTRVGARPERGGRSPRRGRRAIRWPPAAISAPASPATARRAVSPAIRPTRPGDRPFRPTAPTSLARRVVGSWRHETSAPASSVTRRRRWS